MSAEKIGKKKKILIAILVAVCVLITFFVGIFAYLYQSGKNSLKKTLLETENIGDAAYTSDGKYQYNDDWINILCLGIDKTVPMSERDEDTNSIGQADAVFLASINPEENAFQIIAIPRNTMITLEMYDSEGTYLGEREGQLCLQYAYADGAQESCQLTAAAVSRLMGGIPIHAYAAINMSAIPVINDAVGGVEITMEDDYTDFNPKFEKGATVRLQGEEVLDYLHKRDITVFGSANERTARQKQYLLAFMAQAKQAVKDNPGIISTVYGELTDAMVTSMELDQVVYLVTEGLDCAMTEDNLHILEGTIIRGENYEEFYPDEEDVQNLLIEIFYKEATR